MQLEITSIEDAEDEYSYELRVYYMKHKIHGVILRHVITVIKDFKFCLINEMYIHSSCSSC